MIQKVLQYYIMPLHMVTSIWLGFYFQREFKVEVSQIERRLYNNSNVASDNEHVTFVKLLEVNNQDREGWTPLHAATCWMQPEVN